MVTLREGMQMFSQGVGQLGAGMEKMGEYGRRRKDVEAIGGMPEEEFRGGGVGKRLAAGAAAGGDIRGAISALMPDMSPQTLASYYLQQTIKYPDEPKYKGAFEKVKNLLLALRPVYGSSATLPDPTTFDMSLSDFDWGKIGINKSDILNPQYKEAEPPEEAGFVGRLFGSKDKPGVPESFVSPAFQNWTLETTKLYDKAVSDNDKQAYKEYTKRINDFDTMVAEGIKNSAYFKQSPGLWDSMPETVKQTNIERAKNKILGGLYTTKGTGASAEAVPVSMEVFIPAYTRGIVKRSKATQGGNKPPTVQVPPPYVGETKEQYEKRTGLKIED